MCNTTWLNHCGRGAVKDLNKHKATRAQQQQDRPPGCEEVGVHPDVIGAQQKQEDRDESESAAQSHSAMGLNSSGFLALSQQLGLAYDGCTKRQ